MQVLMLMCVLYACMPISSKSGPVNAQIHGRRIARNKINSRLCIGAFFTKIFSYAAWKSSVFLVYVKKNNLNTGGLLFWNLYSLSAFSAPHIRFVSTYFLFSFIFFLLPFHPFLAFFHSYHSFLLKILSSSLSPTVSCLVFSFSFRWFLCYPFPSYPSCLSFLLFFLFLFSALLLLPCAIILEHPWGARNRVGIGLSFRPASYIGWRNSFLGINSGAP
jgi:hypothetical protein